VSILRRLHPSHREAWEDIIITFQRGKIANIQSKRRKDALLAIAALLEEEEELEKEQENNTDNDK